MNEPIDDAILDAGLEEALRFLAEQDAAIEDAQSRGEDYFVPEEDR